MADIDLDPIRARYSAALDARPSKGTDIGSKGYNALTDSVADVPALLDEITSLQTQAEWVRKMANRHEGHCGAVSPYARGCNCRFGDIQAALSEDGRRG